MYEHRGQTKLGGGEGVEGLYGSLKRTGMQRVLDCMVAKCQMGKSSHLVDIGAGLGRCITYPTRLLVGVTRQFLYKPLMPCPAEGGLAYLLISRVGLDLGHNGDDLLVRLPFNSSMQSQAVCGIALRSYVQLQ